LAIETLFLSNDAVTLIKLTLQAQAAMVSGFSWAASPDGALPLFSANYGWQM